jgi:hypothetical protein
MNPVSLSVLQCGGLALKSNLAYFGMQGAICFGGNNGSEVRDFSMRLYGGASAGDSSSHLAMDPRG